MKEDGFNSIASNSLLWGYKIPDPPALYATQSSKRPFDGIGQILINNEKWPVYFESKHDSEPKAFNLNRVQDHQADALTANMGPRAKTWLLYSVEKGRGDHRVYIFDWEAIKPYWEAKVSIHQKILGCLPYNSVKKKLFAFEHIIYREELEKCLPLQCTATSVEETND